MSRLVRFVAPAILLIAVALPSASAAATKRSTLGTQLVDRYFRDLQRHDLGDLRLFLSSAFQIQRANGSRTTKSAFLRNPASIGSFKLRGLVITSTANTLVASFQASIHDEVINGKRYTSAYKPRLMVFARGAKGWQVLCLGNFNVPVA